MTAFDGGATLYDRDSAATRGRPWRFVVLGLALVGVLATACGGNASNQSSAPGATAAAPTADKKVKGPADLEKAVDGGKLVFGMEGEPEGVDSTRYALAVSGHLVASAVFDPLATIDSNGKAVPYLAKSIDPSNDDKTWTIVLPEGVKFHDGTPLDADIVKANLEQYRKSLITSAAFQTVSNVEKKDDKTVVVTLTEPWAAFPGVMTSQLGYIMSQSTLDDPAKSVAPVGTGPFVFDGHVKDQQWSFKKNKDYWRKGLPHLDAIEFKPVPDDVQRVSGLEAGDLDAIMTSKSEAILTLRAGPYKLVDYSDGEESFFTMNTQQPPFDNVTARRAVAYATDQVGFLEKNMQNVQKYANGPFAPGQLGHLEDSGYPKYDLNKAKELVAQYKQETGKDLEFSLLTVNDPSNMRDNQFFAAGYKEAGMKVELQGLPQINLIPKVATGGYQIAAFRLFGFNDPDVDTVWWRSGSVQPPPAISLNFPQFKDPEVDKAISKATSSKDDKERNEAYQTINRRFGEMVPYIWLGRVTWVMAAQPRVNGIYPAANGTVQTLGAKTWVAELWINK